MALLTFERCWSREQKRDARAFAIPGFLSGACFLQEGVQADRPVEQFISEETIWLTARDGDQIVAVFALEPRPVPRAVTSLSGEVMTHVGLVLSPAYDRTALMANMGIAWHELIPCAAGTPTLSQGFEGPAMDAMRASVFGAGSEIFPVPSAGRPDLEGLFYVVMYRPEIIPAHFDVPLA